MIPTMESLAGFITGFGVVLFLVYLYFRKGSKQRRFDERYQEVHAKARTLSWSLTLIVLVVMWLGALIYEGPKLAFILAATAYGIMLISYAIAVFMFNKKF